MNLASRLAIGILNPKGSQPLAGSPARRWSGGVVVEWWDFGWWRCRSGFQPLGLRRKAAGRRFYLAAARAWSGGAVGLRVAEM